ncbi:GNAT family N-acetyltransferase [Iamia sp. SCSIO 61187]|uniref:GNAT family N-acetyltransferase n=1 Tax=Iamia sp. SCSIO 61187 TaxID=2722752 RepID=UPI001C634988|nr:GNAT family N-acetyltransferase [Iamia sp. SCSIO 61187]QYG93784.1 GNAT family N-acetyltransferase [Iamia sp. SCSIO 61187]
MSPEVLVGRTAEIDDALLRQTRTLMDRAFDDFTDHDWVHGLGGHHVLVVEEGMVVAHAAVVRRTLWVGDDAVAAGYVESVATDPDVQGRGHGSTAMARIDELVRRHHELGALATSRHGFYERLGWERWRGLTFVRGADGTAHRTAAEDGAIMVLRSEASADMDLTVALTCEERPGDDW